MAFGRARDWPGVWLAWRDRLAGDPVFRRWAGRFPLTRWIARRHARALFDLNAGFVYSQILQACVRLDLFSPLAGGPLPLSALARHCQLEPERCAVLLRAAVALRLLAMAAPDSFRLGPLGAALLDNPAVVGMVRHHALFYRDLQDPVALLQGQETTGLASYWSYVDAPPESLGAAEGQRPQVADYSHLMTVSQVLVADQVLDAYPVGRHRTLLDVGGGEGAFVREALRRHPRLQGWVFDLPAVSARSTDQPLPPECAGRLHRHAGDFRVTPLPRGADLITLVRVLHDHHDDVVRALLRAVFQALPPGGVLLIAEPLAGTPGAEPMGDAYFGLYFLAMGSGRPRRFERYRELLLEAGFAAVRQHATAIPLQASLIEARVAATPV